MKFYVDCLNFYFVFLSWHLEVSQAEDYHLSSDVGNLGFFVCFFENHNSFSVIAPDVGTVHLSIMSPNICFILCPTLHFQFDLLAY